MNEKHRQTRKTSVARAGNTGCSSGFDRRAFLKMVGAAAAFCLAPGGWAAAAAKPKIAIIAPHDSCPAGERPFALRVAKHLQRWLAMNGIAAALEDDTNPAAALKDCRLAILVMCQTPSEKELAELAKFVKNGGKIASFYGTSPRLAALMGVRLGKYSKPPPGTYAQMVFLQGGPKHAPAKIVQSSANIFTADAIEGKSKTIALWHDRKNVSTKDAAIIQSAAGWWITHIFTADGDEKAKELFLLSIAGESCPGIWAYAAWRKERDSRLAADRAFAAKHPLPKGEIHAVWEQSGEGLYPGDWPRTVKELENAHITDLYLNVCGAAFAHYPSKVLAPSAVLKNSGNQLFAALKAAEKSPVRVHAWVKCFLAERATPATMQEFSRKKWRMLNQDGTESTYLDPSNPALRKHLLDALDELAKTYAVDGMHLDFIRWPGSPDKYKSPNPGFKPPDADLVKWRAMQIETFLAAARTRVKSIRPQIQLSAAVLGSWHGAFNSMGQDWKAWMDKGLVDKLVPMNYTEKLEEFASWTREQTSTAARAKKIIAGIGVTANESRLSPRQVMEQIVAARKAKCAGFAFFDLDYMLVNDIIPSLRAGI